MIHAKKKEPPYKECLTCKTLTDCPCPDVEDLGDCSNPLPPSVCLRPLDVMKETWKKHKKKE